MTLTKVKASRWRNDAIEHVRAVNSFIPSFLHSFIPSFLHL